MPSPIVATWTPYDAKLPILTLIYFVLATCVKVSHLAPHFSHIRLASGKPDNSMDGLLSQICVENLPAIFLLSPLNFSVRICLVWLADTQCPTIVSTWKTVIHYLELVICYLKKKKKKFKNTLCTDYCTVLYWLLYCTNVLYYNVLFQDFAAIVLCSYNASNCNNDVFYILDCRLLNSRSYKVMNNMLVYLNRHHVM